MKQKNKFDRLKLIWYYIETRFVLLYLFFGFKRNDKVIPKGMYCYIIDEERNIKEPCKDGSYWIKKCPYYRSTGKTGGIACTYDGFFGFDLCLYDQCKICGINK